MHASEKIIKHKIARISKPYRGKSSREDIAELANVLAWDAVGAQPEIEPYLVQHAEWQRPCGVALGCRSLNSRGIKMLRRAAVLSKNHATKQSLKWQLNTCRKRICSHLQIHGMQISQLLEVHQLITINALWKLRRIFSDSELKLCRRLPKNRKLNFLRGEMPEWIEMKLQ